LAPFPSITPTAHRLVSRFVWAYRIVTVTEE
jgi:hypothetical protein